MTPESPMTDDAGKVRGLVVRKDTRRGLSYIYLVGEIDAGMAKRQIVADSGDIIIDLDADGAVIGIELLSRKRLHSDLSAIATEYEA